MPESALIDIRPDHWEIVRDILKKHVPQYEVWAFGSRAKWTAKEYSDLDLAVITDTPLSILVSANLSDDFSESDLPWRVDVVDWAATSESFQKIIARDKVVVQLSNGLGVVGEWRTVKLIDACGVSGGVQTGPFGSQLHQKDYVSVGTPIITVEHLGENRITKQNLPLVSSEDVTRLKKYTLAQGDIVFSRVGSVDRRSLVRSEEAGWLFSGRCLRVRLDSKIADSVFVSLQLGLDSLKEHIRSIAVGATMPSLNTRLLSDIPITLPPLNEQRAIAHILGTLDDKIELNRRMNETLESMARALFKSWFVDFDPVRAKMDGRWQRGQSLPGLPAHLYDLFPERLVESDLGEIPAGWEQQNIGNIGSVICGKTPPTKNPEYYGEDVPFITIPEMHGSIFAVQIKKRLSHSGAASQVNKMLPIGAICVSCIATLGLVTITTEPSQTNQQINSVVPTQENETYYWYWALKNLGDEIKAGGSGGSVLGNLSTGRFSELKINTSTTALRLAYNSMVESMFAKILANEQASRTLAQLRDTLLPKLISGELRLPEAGLQTLAAL